jgi:hypothetical protein
MRRGNVKEVVRYGEAFKLRLVEDIAGGKYRAVQPRLGAGNCSTYRGRNQPVPG